jgi:hypothetical protein
VTTLEEVFIKVAHATKTIAQQDDGAKEGRRNSQTSKRLPDIAEDANNYESKVNDLEAVEDREEAIVIYIYVYIYKYIMGRKKFIYI